MAIKFNPAPISGAVIFALGYYVFPRYIPILTNITTLGGRIDLLYGSVGWAAAFGSGIQVTDSSGKTVFGLGLGA